MTTPSSSELAPGSVLGGYRIGRLLGRGGMGAVYAAEQIEDGREVALKVLAPGLVSADDRERFLREGQVAAALNHPNAVYVFGTDEIDGTLVIAMELVAGGTLEEKVDAAGPLPWAEAVRDILQVVDGLAAAAALGILHRDIKPANCFVTVDGAVKVGDFGLSRPRDEADQLRLTQTGMFLGTPVFSSPEQLLGERLDVESDIYSVGATLYYLLTAQYPFATGNVMRLIADVTNGAPTPVATHRPDLPPALAAAVMRCLARRPEDRVRDYAALRATLVECLPSDGVPAPLSRRIAAFAGDMVLAGTLSSAAWAGLVALGLPMAKIPTSYPDVAIWTMVVLLVFFMAFGLLEGRTGASPAKQLAGLRVVRETGGAPGAAAGGMRALFAWIILDLDTVLKPVIGVTAGLVLWVGAIAVILFPARRANGWRGLHDRLSGTRVVRATPRRLMQPEAPVRTAEPGARSAGARMGPYEVRGPLRPGAGILLGFDSRLQRDVWIVPRSEQEPMVSVEDRRAARPGAPRWLAGRRQGSDAWDAYAALAGRPLAERLGSDADWPEVRRWCLDLAAELAAREAGPAPAGPPVTLGQVWIADTGSAQILPLALDAAPPDAAATPPLAALAASLLEAGRVTLPLSGREALETIRRTPSDLATHAAVLGRTEAVSGRVSRAARGIASGTLAAMISLMLLMAFVVQPEVFEAGVRESRGSPAAAPASTPAGRLDRLMRYLHDERPRTPADSTRHRLARAYLALEFSELIARERDSLVPVVGEGHLAVAERILAGAEPVDSATARAAWDLVDVEWRGEPPRSRHSAAASMIGFITMFGVIAVLSTLLTGRGLPLRLAGLEVVRRDGRRVGRPRLLLRQVVLWGLLLFAAVTIAVGTGIAGRIAPSWTPGATVVWGVGLLLILAVSVASWWWRPHRGIPEVFSDTILMPE